MTKRKRALHPPALNVATAALVARLHDHGKFADDARAIAQEVVREYLDAIGTMRQRTRPASEHSHRLAAMKPGDVEQFVPMAMQSLRGRMRTARKLAGNDAMRWAASTLPSGFMQARRLEDDGLYVREITSPISQELIAMAVGDSRISQAITAIRGKGALGTNHKAIARRYLDVADADWTTRATNQGVRLTRIR